MTHISLDNFGPIWTHTWGAKYKIIPEIIELHWLRLWLCEDFRVERNKMFFVRYFLVSELNIHK